MKMLRRAALGLVVMGGLLVAASCNKSERPAGSTSGDAAISTAPACAAGSHELSCTCPTVGETATCCQGGTQRCTQVGEFTVWGPCHSAAGAVVNCAAACANGEFGDCDAGTPMDLAKAQVCSCVPGKVRWCDEPNYCTWGKQTCGPDGNWGACIEAGTQPAGCMGFPFLFYDQDCCAQAGECCQDMSHPTAAVSLGNCPGVYTCQ